MKKTVRAMYGPASTKKKLEIKTGATTNTMNPAIGLAAASGVS